MYLIDSDILIWGLRGKEEYVDFIQKIKKEAPLSISTITVTEIYKNIFPTELLITEGVLNEFEKWDVTFNIAKQAGLYWNQFNKKFSNLNILDCIVAATARENNLTVLTLNTRHYPMADIRLKKPLKN